MTAQQLEELLGKVTPWPPVSGHETAHDEALIALAPSLARRVLAAEKLAAEVERVSFSDNAIAMLTALTAYRESSK